MMMLTIHPGVPAAGGNWLTVVEEALKAVLVLLVTQRNSLHHAQTDSVDALAQGKTKRPTLPTAARKTSRTDPSLLPLMMTLSSRAGPHRRVAQRRIAGPGTAAHRTSDPNRGGVVHVGRTSSGRPLAYAYAYAYAAPDWADAQRHDDHMHDQCDHDHDHRHRLVVWGCENLDSDQGKRRDAVSGGDFRFRGYCRCVDSNGVGASN